MALALASALACGMAWAEPPEMFGCGAAGPAAQVERDGTVVQDVTPDEMAQFYIAHCDYVAVGRFTAITVADYDRIVPKTVEASFVADEVLVGPELFTVRVRMLGGMLVQPGESVSRNAAFNVYRAHESAQLGLHDAIVEDLRDLHRTGASLTDARLRDLEDQLGKLWPRGQPIDRATEVALGDRNGFVTAGTTFYREGGAVAPSTQFLVGLDADQHEGHDRLIGIYSLLHWGDYAVAVSEAIRAAK